MAYSIEFDLSEDEIKWARSRRISYLKAQIPVLTDDLTKDMDEINAIMPAWFREAAVINRDIINRSGKIQSMHKELKFLRSSKYKSGGVASYEIERAKNADLTVLNIFPCPLKRCGKVYKTICPFHEDHDPSLIIYPPSKGFYCFSCQTGGDNITFIRKLLSLNFPDAVRYLN